jgi:hypothetical protein
MSAIGLSRGKGFVMSACAEYGQGHLVFPRQQSNALRALDWEKTPPMKSWIGLLGPWLGLAGSAAIILPFIVY